MSILNDRLKKAVAGVALTAFMLPTVAFGATVNINLKDKHGTDLTNLTGIEVKILDTVGGVIFGPVTPTSATVVATDLSPNESYNIILKKTSSISAANPATLNVNNYMTKSLRFESQDETINKNFLISEQPIAAPNVRISGLSECAGQSIDASAFPLKIKLYPIETSTRDFSVESFESTINKTGNYMFDNNGNMNDVGSLAHNIPSGSYKYQLSFGAGASCLSDWTLISKTAIRVNPNSVAFLNAGMTKPLKITSNFKLRNIAGADIALDGSSLNIEVKDAVSNAVVYSKNISSPSGLSFSDISDILENKNYVLKATLTKEGLSTETTRNINLTNGPKTVNINFTEPVAYAITMKVIDGRTSASINNGQMVIKDSNDQILDTINLEGNPIVKNLVRGKQYKLSVTSNGYNERKMTIYPREARTIEVGLTKATQ